MNVIVTNKQQNQLSTLDIDIIKSISGIYEANEIVEMFKNFFYSKMILDVTAIKNYDNPASYQIIAKGLDPDKIIFYLPEGSNLCTSNFLSRLISIGIFNFTTNTDGVKYLLKKSNTYKDVQHIQQMASQSGFIENSNDQPKQNNPMSQNINSSQSYSQPDYNANNSYNSQSFVSMPQNRGNGPMIIGFRNVSKQAGASTFIYIMKKELNSVMGDNIIAIEVDKNDFQFFNDKKMISTTAVQLRSTIDNYRNASIILIDLNELKDDNMCGDVIYLLEPTMIKLNRVVRRNRNIFGILKNKKLVLNKSLLNNKDVSDFEYEANMRVFYNMPPLDERKRNPAMNDFLSRMGIIGGNNQNNNGRIFGLFRR